MWKAVRTGNAVLTVLYSPLAVCQGSQDRRGHVSYVVCDFFREHQDVSVISDEGEGEYVALRYSQNPYLKSEIWFTQPLCWVNGSVAGASLMHLLV